MLSRIVEWLAIGSCDGKSINQLLGVSGKPLGRRSEPPVNILHGHRYIHSDNTNVAKTLRKARRNAKT